MIPFHLIFSWEEGLSVASTLFAAGFLSVVAGFILILLSFSGRGEAESRKETKGFGIISFGPFPIILSTGRRWRALTLLSLLLILIIFMVFLLPSYLS